MRHDCGLHAANWEPCPAPAVDFVMVHSKEDHDKLVPMWLCAYHFDHWMRIDAALRRIA